MVENSQKVEEPRLEPSGMVRVASPPKPRRTVPKPAWQSLSLVAPPEVAPARSTPSSSPVGRSASGHLVRGQYGYHTHLLALRVVQWGMKRSGSGDGSATMFPVPGRCVLATESARPLVCGLIHASRVPFTEGGKSGQAYQLTPLVWQVEQNE